MSNVDAERARAQGPLIDAELAAIDRRHNTLADVDVRLRDALALYDQAMAQAGKLLRQPPVRPHFFSCSHLDQPLTLRSCADGGAGRQPGTCKYDAVLDATAAIPAASTIRYARDSDAASAAATTTVHAAGALSISTIRSAATAAARPLLSSAMMALC